MIQAKKFIDRVSSIESRQGKDIVISLSDARMLRDEIAKLLMDHYAITNSTVNTSPSNISVEVIGNKF